MARYGRCTEPVVPIRYVAFVATGITIRPLGAARISKSPSESMWASAPHGPTSCAPSGRCVPRPPTFGIHWPSGRPLPRRETARIGPGVDVTHRNAGSRCAARWLHAWLCLGSLLGPAACGPAGPPHVLVVTFDTTRYDRIGPSGDRDARTPTLEALAARGLVFDRAFASAAITLPSHTTIFTGLEPLSHGVHNNGRFTVPQDLETVAEHLRNAGYDTAAFVSAFVLDAKFHLDQGFDVYSDETPQQGRSPFDTSVAQRPGVEVADEAIDWLARRGSARPFLLWAHFYDPHFPRNLEPPFDQMLDPYAAEIAYADAQLGRLLAAANEAAGSRGLFVLFTADHGEGLGEHGEATHAILAYDSTLHVPLILAGPGVPEGARTDVYARHIDVMPTLLSVAGLRVPSDLPGRNLLEAARDGAALEKGGEEVVGYFESANPRYEFGWAEIQGVRTAGWKYTGAPEPEELYDVLADPDEQENLIDREPEMRSRMRALRAELDERSRGLSSEAPSPPDLSPEERERLAALGYLEAPASFADDEKPDPRRYVRALGFVNVARSQARAGSYRRAIATLESLAPSPVVRPFVLRNLAPIYRTVGRLEEAMAAYREVLGSTGSTMARNELARTLLMAQRPEDALEVLADSPELSAQARWLRAQGLTRLGRHAEAGAEIDRAAPRRRRKALHLRAALVLDAAPLPDGEQQLRRYLEEAPDDPLLKSTLGFYLAVEGSPEHRAEARDLLEAAGAAAPENAEVLSYVGWAFKRLGLTQQAIEVLEKTVALDGERHLDRVRLAYALRDAGERQRARALLRESLMAHPGAGWATRAREVERELTREIGSVRGAGADA